MTSLLLLLSIAWAEPVDAAPVPDTPDAPHTDAPPAPQPSPEPASPPPAPAPAAPTPQPEPPAEPPPEPPAEEVAPAPVPAPEHHEPTPDPEHHEPEPGHEHPQEAEPEPPPAEPAPHPTPTPPAPVADPFVRTPASPFVPPVPAAPAFLPDIPQRGWSKALALVLAVAGALVLAGVARRGREDLREGVLSSLLGGIETLARGVVAFCGISLVAQIVPQGLLPVLPWAILAGALAVGWSLREALLDIVAWIQLSSEGRLTRDRWVVTPDGEGRIVRMGLRATWLDDGQGRHVAVPNRRLTRDTVATDQARWPRVAVELHLPNLPDEVARGALREAVLLCPWVAPEPDLAVAGDPDGGGRWTVQVRLLEGRFREPLAGTLRERVLDQLRTP